MFILYGYNTAELDHCRDELATRADLLRETNNFTILSRIYDGSVDFLTEFTQL